METVNIHQAKTQLSRLLERTRNGEEIIIAKAGTPIARLVRYEPAAAKIAPPGAMQGEGWIADDFDAPLDELFQAFDSIEP